MKITISHDQANMDPKIRTTRKNKPGAGRPKVGRSAGLSRISPVAKDRLQALQSALAEPGKRPPSLADAMEIASWMAWAVIKGKDPRAWLPGREK